MESRTESRTESRMESRMESRTESDGVGRRLSRTALVAAPVDVLLPLAAPAVQSIAVQRVCLRAAAHAMVTVTIEHVSVRGIVNLSAYVLFIE